MRPLLICALIMTVAAGFQPVLAADQPAPRARVSADVVKAAVKPASVKVADGEVQFEVVIDIAEPWHLYDHSYAHDPESFYIGVDLQPGEEADLAAFNTRFPLGKPGEFMGETVVMLYGVVTVGVTAKLPAGTTGEVTLPLVLTAQACDDKICLQPSDIPVVAKIRIP